MRLIGKYDNFIDRKNRLLDYQLAIYGERFSQNTLRLFNYYYTPEELDNEIIGNKTNFLKNIRGISLKRGGSFNYRKLSWNTGDVPGLKLKTGILLGLKYFHKRSLTIVFIREGLKLISDEQFRRLSEGTLELQFSSFDNIPERIEEDFRPIPLKSEKNISREDIRALFNEIALFRNNVIHESFLRYGIHLGSYRMGSVTSEDQFQVVFKTL